MPFYEFECEKCKKSFALQLSVKAHDSKDYRCPDCHGKDVKQLITSVRVQTSKKS